MTFDKILENLSIPIHVLLKVKLTEKRKLDEYKKNIISLFFLKLHLNQNLQKFLTLGEQIS